MKYKHSDSPVHGFLFIATIPFPRGVAANLGPFRGGYGARRCAVLTRYGGPNTVGLPSLNRRLNSNRYGRLVCFADSYAAFPRCRGITCSLQPLVAVRYLQIEIDPQRFSSIVPWHRAITVVARRRRDVRKKRSQTVGISSNPVRRNSGTVYCSAEFYTHVSDVFNFQPGFRPNDVSAATSYFEQNGPTHTVKIKTQ